jgi:hypothetical protein
MFNMDVLMAIAGQVYASEHEDRGHMPSPCLEKASHRWGQARRSRESGLRCSTVPRRAASRRGWVRRARRSACGTLAALAATRSSCRRRMWRRKTGLEASRYPSQAVDSARSGTTATKERWQHVGMLEHSSQPRIQRRVGFMHTRSTQHADVCEVVLRVYGHQCSPVQQEVSHNAGGISPRRSGGLGPDRSAQCPVENVIQVREIGHG